eukprot:CAMPEP_0119327520 /NCGR_PEP_ID=MMETSP1333-20130426/70974_1 /TAXON_ID=418940 /ORGANISM="Scyphosphaera apsteinii, Strain RCC1455" /LENGTH=66 /DNA_ID=CAMNT_0007336133 /DNA_START=26 /DNA_END=222 /DNA_ORIENTATION=+
MPDALLDGKPMLQQVNGMWCCLLCRRQFQTRTKLDVHCAKSSLHLASLQTAMQEQRIEMDEEAGAG